MLKLLAEIQWKHAWLHSTCSYAVENLNQVRSMWCNAQTLLKPIVLALKRKSSIWLRTSSAAFSERKVVDDVHPAHQCSSEHVCHVEAWVCMKREQKGRSSSSFHKAPFEEALLKRHFDTLTFLFFLSSVSRSQAKAQHSDPGFQSLCRESAGKASIYH